MSKKSCQKNDYEVPNEPKYICKKCEREVKKEEQVCEPKKIKVKPEKE